MNNHSQVKCYIAFNHGNFHLEMQFDICSLKIVYYQKSLRIIIVSYFINDSYLLASFRKPLKKFFVVVADIGFVFF